MGQIQTVEKVVEIPQVQTVEKVVEVPEVQTVAGATRSVNLPSAPVRQTAPAEVVQVTEVGPPLPAESAPATRSQAPMAASAAMTMGAPGISQSFGSAGTATGFGGGAGFGSGAGFGGGAGF